MCLGVTSAIRIDFEGERGAIFGQRTAIFAQLMEQLLEIENGKNTLRKIT
jgi:hypothetical protein